MNIICKQQYVREDNEKNMLKNKMTIEHMNLHYGDFHALKDINLNIKENQITAFIGPSGCGKSTLLKSLNRMNDLVEGCKIDGLIALDGEDIYGNNMDVNLLRKRVGMVMWHSDRELTVSIIKHSWMRLWRNRFVMQLSGTK